MANQTAHLEQSIGPVNLIDRDDPERQLEEGMALCLSGGGYRAMVFHLGVLWRLNDAGMLVSLKRISSVSGGSITAAQLAIRWHDLGLSNGTQRAHEDRFIEYVAEPILAMAGRTIDRCAVLGGLIGRKSINERIVAAYDRYLFKGRTLQDLPDCPRFVINATSVQSGALCRFMKPAIRDWRVGEVIKSKISLATAVAASSAFPPVLSPCIIHFDAGACTSMKGCDLHKSPFTSKFVLSDGGVYDNLGLETAWKRYRTVLVSDAGAKMPPDVDPKRDWARHAYRVFDIVDNQVRSLRKRQLIESFKAKRRDGAYWGIRSSIANYHLPDVLPCPPDRTQFLAAIPTRLKGLEKSTQHRLVNWGYAICDAAIRKHVDPSLPIGRFPCQAGV